MSSLKWQFRNEISRYLRFLKGGIEKERKNSNLKKLWSVSKVRCKINNRKYYLGDEDERDREDDDDLEYERDLPFRFGEGDGDLLIGESDLFGLLDGDRDGIGFFFDWLTSLQSRLGFWVFHF